MCINERIRREASVQIRTIRINLYIWQHQAACKL